MSKSLGVKRERQVKLLLEGDDWVVVRAAGSLGCIDLVACRKGNRPRFIEVKSDLENPYENFRPADRAQLAFAAELAGAEAWLAWWPPHGRLHWIPELEWPPIRPREMAA